MPDPRLLISVPVHERPEVVLDQVENFRAFLPGDTQIVLHLSQSLGVDPAEVAPLLPEGVHVNPSSLATRHGDLAFVHNANVRWGLRELEPFDYVVLHASNDAYFRPGAAERIASATAGVFVNPVGPESPWSPAVAAHRDPVVRAMLADLGASQIFGGMSEGSFFATALFTEMLELMDRHYRPGEGEPYFREEIFYPTLAGHLCREAPVTTLVYSDASNPANTEIGPALIWSLIDGVYGEAGPVTGYDLDHVYAVKRIARELHEPNRALVRTLGRATGARMRTAPPFEARRFVALAFAADLVADPSLLALYLEPFDADDETTLAILVRPWEGDLVQPLTALVRAAGGDAAGAPDITVFTVAPGSFGEATLRWSVDAVILSDDATPPDLFDDVLVVRPRTAADLRALAAARRSVVRR
jgi:hypothetical protein